MRHRPPTYLRDLIVLVASFLILAITALYMLAVRSAHALDVPDCRAEKCTVRIVLDDGSALDCGKVRIWKNATGQKWAMVRIPCTHVPAPSTPRPTASPRVTARPTPTATDPCPGGCIVWDPATDSTKCVRPCR